MILLKIIIICWTYICFFLFDDESFGVAILEASACAKPVIVSRVGGLPEVVEDNVTGFIVPSKNEKTAADAIENLILNEDFRIIWDQKD